MRREEHHDVPVAPEDERRVVVVVAPQALEDQALAELAARRVARDPHVAGGGDPAGERVAIVRDRARIAEVRPRARPELPVDCHGAPPRRAWRASVRASGSRVTSSAARRCPSAVARPAPQHERAAAGHQPREPGLGGTPRPPERDRGAERRAVRRAQRGDRPLAAAGRRTSCDQATTARPSSSAATARRSRRDVGAQLAGRDQRLARAASDTCTRAPCRPAGPCHHHAARGRDRRLADRDAAAGIDVLGRAERAPAQRAVQLQPVARGARDVLDAVDERGRPARADDGPRARRSASSASRCGRRTPARAPQRRPDARGATSRSTSRRRHRARRSPPRRSVQHGRRTKAETAAARRTRGARLAHRRLQAPAPVRGAGTRPRRPRRCARPPTPRSRRGAPRDTVTGGRRPACVPNATTRTRRCAPRGSGRRSRHCRRRRCRRPRRDRRGSSASASGRGPKAAPGAAQRAHADAASPDSAARSGSPGTPGRPVDRHVRRDVADRDDLRPPRAPARRGGGGEHQPPWTHPHARVGSTHREHLARRAGCGPARARALAPPPRPSTCRGGRAALNSIIEGNGGGRRPAARVGSERVGRFPARSPWRTNERVSRNTSAWRPEGVGRAKRISQMSG